MLVSEMMVDVWWVMYDVDMLFGNLWPSGVWHEVDEQEEVNSEETSCG